MNFSSFFRPLHLLACLLISPICGSAAVQDSQPDTRPKKVFAHYMGCYPVGFGALSLASMQRSEQAMTPDAPSYNPKVGGRWRDYPLTPEDYAPTREESMNLEIRRAMRMGLDGFSVDVLAGDKAALENLDMMFKVAEEHNYPFEITFCLDGPGLNADAVRYLFEKHKNSPKLARRNGKPLFMAYHSQRWAKTLKPSLTDAEMIKPEGIALQCEYLKKLEEIAGEPFHAMFDVELLTGPFRKQLSRDEAFWQMAAKEFAKAYGGLSVWQATVCDYDTAAKAAHEAGLDWGDPVWPQYQSICWNYFHLKTGSELLRECWERAVKNDSTVIQIATWNDYTESTNVAPGQQTGYAIADLNALLIQRWKTGEWPKLERDRIYFFYPLYPKGSRVYPFHDFASDIGGELEVVTYLTKPGKIVMPGRNASWEAPAGLFAQKLPPTAGPIVAELYREKKKVTALTAREPITTRPFRAQHSIVACCTEDDRYWKQDFPGVTTPPVTFYGDDDGDGLPNWFEMYYCGKLKDFTAATWLNPNDKPKGVNRTYLESYLRQTDPFREETSPAAGTAWNLLANPHPLPQGGKVGVSTNPERDSEGRDIWSYRSSVNDGPWKLLAGAAINRFNGTYSSFGYSRNCRNALAPEKDQATLGTISYRWIKLDDTWKSWKIIAVLTPSAEERVGVQWSCPADGAYAFDCAVEPEKAGSAGTLAKLTTDDGKTLWASAPGSADQTRQALSLKKGQAVRLEAAQSGSQPSKTGVVIFRFTATFEKAP